MKNNPVKQGRVFEQYEKLCGIQHGGSRPNNSVLKITQKEIAEELGIHERDLKRLLEIERKLTPEIKDLLDTGIISKTSASKIWSKLS